MTLTRRTRRRRLAILERDGYRCVYCGQVLPPHLLTVDHVQPRIKRGDHSPGNLVCACLRCNKAKGSLAAWKYLQDRPEQRANFLRYAVHVWRRHARAVRDAGPA